MQKKKMRVVQEEDVIGVSWGAGSVLQEEREEDGDEVWCCKESGGEAGRLRD